MPPLIPTAVEVRVGKADTKTSDKLAIPGTLAVAQNVVMNDTGKYERRSGTTLLTTITDAETVHDHEGETLIASDTALFSRFGGANVQRDVLYLFDTRHEPVGATPFGKTGHDMIVTNGQRWSVWVDEQEGIYYCVRDVATGAYVVGETLLSFGTWMRCPRIFAAGTNVLITYVETDVANTTTLWANKIAVATPQSPGSATAISNQYLSTTGNDVVAGYDGVVISSSEVVFAFLAANGGVATDERIRLQLWNVGTMTTTTTLTESADSGSGAGGIAIFRHTDNTYYVWQADEGGDRIRQLIASSLLLSFISTVTIKSYGAAVTLKAITGFVDASDTAHILVERHVVSGTTTRPSVEYKTRTSGGAISEIIERYGVSLASSIFTSGGFELVLLTAPLPGTVNNAGSLLVAFATSLFPTGRALSRLAAVDVPAEGLGKMLPKPQATASGFAVAADYFVSPTQIGAAVVYLDPAVKKRWLEAAGLTTIPGSWPLVYDSLTVGELGFEGPPRKVDHGVAGLGAMANGTYYYKACWLWVDTAGREHRSEPCPQAEVIVAGGANDRTVTLAYESMLATRRSSEIMLEVYRTEADPQDPTSAAFFRVTTVGNSPQAIALSAPDGMSDATLVTQQRLYDLGGTVLVNSPASACTAMELWGQRLWSADGRFLVFSKLMLDENKGIEHSDVNFIAVDDKYGDFVALADAGQRLLAFKRNAIYAVTGAGPDNNGNGEFPPVDRLELPLGARSQLSVISTELGVFFQDDGTGQIWIIGGERGAEYIGADVEGIAAGLTIVEAIQVGRQVRFHSTQGTTLVFDLHHKIWTWFTAQPATGAGVVNGVAHYIQPDGDVRYDNAATFAEGADLYQAVLETDWLSFAGIVGHKRIYKIIAVGESKAAHTMAIRTYYKFSTSTEVKSLSAGGATAGHLVEMRPTLQFQRATAVKVRIEDNSPTSASWGLEALVLEVGVERKTARLPSINRAT